MNQNLNIYSQKGCIGCKSCEGGGAAIGRSALLVIIGVVTGGMGLIFLPFYKKCMFCGHNTWMNKHQPRPPVTENPLSTYSTASVGAFPNNGKPAHSHQSQARPWDYPRA